MKHLSILKLAQAGTLQRFEHVDYHMKRQGTNMLWKQYSKDRQYREINNP
ncbi:protein of unknown function [Maridesulfovibrio hydrothermalis AM13 = DSM 14728]|uniref:Uncharacterized protein n=1 Tax=Maridesulfovibrio hydrothermalis AM13 = DSM 14728 TaxID=1121451 RepID=L0R8R5_9BACT|nr:protein of unknown function [Maridesulfovibrio hydrothermalis AM13 = DSM 14728]